MITTTLKDIKNTNAKDITATNEKIQGLTCIAKSYGVYGMNGALLKDEAGNLYKITARTSNLFRYC